MESPYRTVSIRVTNPSLPVDSFFPRPTDAIKSQSSNHSHIAPYHLTQSAPFKFSVKKVKVSNDSSDCQVLKKIKLVTVDNPEASCNGLSKASSSQTPDAVHRSPGREENGQRMESPPISSLSKKKPTVLTPAVPILPPSSASDEFLSASRLIFMKARAYYILKSAEINPNDTTTPPGVFQIAPELTEAAASVTYFPDDILNQLMSKVLFIYPTITNVVSATAFVFWSRDELHSYKLPLKFQSRHQNSKKPIIPGQEDYFKFWDTVFNFSKISDRVIKLENAIKNFRYALIQPSALNLSFFNHLSTGSPTSDQQRSQE